MDEIVAKSIAFLQEIGITVKTGEVDDHSFLPGLSIESGCLFIDHKRLKYPGDILHEAGHIAVVPAAERTTLNATSIIQRKDREAEEMMAIAWSYAAGIHLGIDPAVIFHEEGYKGDSEHLITNFSNGNYLALPMLQWVGLTADHKRAAELSIKPYPAMIKWLRD